MSCLPFYLLLIFFVIGDTSSEAAAGPVLHSDTSSLPTVAYSSNQTTNSQVVSSILQIDLSVQGQIFSSHQLVGHCQEISGMRELLHIGEFICFLLFTSCKSSQSCLSPQFCLWYKVSLLLCPYMPLDMQLFHSLKFLH